MMGKQRPIFSATSHSSPSWLKIENKLLEPVVAHIRQKELTSVSVDVVVYTVVGTAPANSTAISEAMSQIKVCCNSLS
jgi:hypothetical protein